MDSPSHMSDSMMLDDEDMPVPCKGCNNVLEEGKAFELAGNRWHIDCFRCNSCGTLLDSDANLLLLGDGSLICNSCTYSCSACGNKIEELAILTGDQAYCAGCFRCRNCKRKIENLKYARTSQGIFCMSCHESLMARRKKRAKQGPNQRTPTSGSTMNAASPMLSLDKSLPSLPPDPESAFPPAMSDSQATTPTDRPSTRQRPDPHRTNTSRSDNTPQQLSPMAYTGDHHRHGSRSQHASRRHSQISQMSEASVDQSRDSGQDGYSFIPLVLDNSPGPSSVPALSPPSVAPPAPPSGPALLPSTAYKPGGDIQISLDSQYRQQDRTGSSHGQQSRPSYDRKTSGSSSHYEPERERTRPHISTQDRTTSDSSQGRVPLSRQESDTSQRDRPKLGQENSSSSLPTSQETSRPRSSEKTASSSNAAPQLPKNTEKTDKPGFKLGEVPKERKRSIANKLSEFDEKDPDNETDQSESWSPNSGKGDKTPAVFNPGSLPRGDSFRGPPRSLTDSPVVKKPVESPENSTSSSYRSQHSHATSASSGITSPEGPEKEKEKETVGSSESVQLTSKTTVTNITHDSPVSPSHAASSKPARVPVPHHTLDGVGLDTQADAGPAIVTPALPPLRSPVGGLVFDEELRRVFGGSENILKRVSSSVRHGRSHSEAAAGKTSSPKWSRPTSGSIAQEISSPLSPDGRDDPASLRHELRRSTQRIAELEAKLNSAQSAKQLESTIHDKRMTVALLETEREAFLRELMVIKERLDASKDGKSIDMEKLKSDLIRGLTRELESLKTTLKSEIQDLVIQRDQLMDDVETFGRLREQAIQETEQLNLKNTQLADLNNELTRRIQGQFNNNKRPQVPGLGIFDASGNDLPLPADIEKRPTTAAGPGSIHSQQTATPINEQPQDGVEVMVAQKISTFKTGAQKQKFFWKKPAATIIKGAGKGFNRVFQSERDGYPEGTPYESYGQQGQQGGALQNGSDRKLFGTQKKWMKSSKPSANGASSQDVSGTIPIFGGELEARVEFEGSPIPNVVQKCIQEVEMRGMDLEGIYRKSGGATQMREIQDQFERGIDVQFDPELDICSVTSVLKQYFRNLPNPLITYEVYDRFIETIDIHEEGRRIDALKSIVMDLPESHRNVLQFLIFHLARVSARQSENLMTTRNISVVFAPTLVRHLSDEREMNDMHLKNSALQFLIDYNEQIF